MIFNVRTHVNACDCTWGCTDTVRESSLKVDSGRKIPCCTGESNLRWQHAGPMLYQLSYVSTPKLCSDTDAHKPNSFLPWFLITTWAVFNLSTDCLPIHKPASHSAHSMHRLSAYLSSHLCNSWLHNSLKNWKINCLLSISGWKEGVLGLVFMLPAVGGDERKAGQ